MYLCTYDERGDQIHAKVLGQSRFNHLPTKIVTGSTNKILRHENLFKLTAKNPILETNVSNYQFMIMHIMLLNIVYYFFNDLKFAKKSHVKPLELLISWENLSAKVPHHTGRKSNLSLYAKRINLDWTG